MLYRILLKLHDFVQKLRRGDEKRNRNVDLETGWE